MSRNHLLAIAAASAAALLVPVTAGAATLTAESGTLVVRAGAGDDTVYLDDAFNPPDPAQVLRIDGDVPFTEVPAGCAQRSDTTVDCPAFARVRVELGAGADGFGILNHLSVPLASLVVDGGDGNDTLTGDQSSARVETLLGGTGADGLDGLAGNDVLRGGPGDDRIDGGAGNDVVAGEDGNDELTGDDQAPPGADVIDGGAGSDLVKDYRQLGVGVHPPADVSLDGVANDGRPGERDDLVSIERYVAFVNGTFVLTNGVEDWQVWSNLTPGGASTVRALGGDDRIVGKDGVETIDGGAGNDHLEGGRNADTLIGGPGRDVIFGDESNPTCFTSSPERCVQYGNDTILARDGEVDQVDCGAGTDRAVVDAADVVSPNCERVERPGGGAPGGGVDAPVRAKLSGARNLRRALRRGVTVRVKGAPAGRRVRARLLRRGTVVASGKAKAGAAGKATIRVSFARRARRSLRRARRVELTLRVTGARSRKVTFGR